MKPVKLVIWDLDDTFWKGTLSEGPISYSKTNHAIVIELTRRGIVNTISSKNNFDEVKARLGHEGIWDYFVFPKIAWQPKGHIIKTIIEEMQLRAENVLFIDDNHMNLEEAKYYNPGLQTAGPEILDRLLEREACKGKDDRSLSRLKQYQILEKKVSDQKVSLCSNEDFLRSSKITVQINADCQKECKRILELINRTNQLNYTKVRLQKDELVKLINDTSVQKAYVRVQDKYGDYGICGFYALRDSRLLHFVFSCRILNMGVENWVYHKLGCPDLDIAGETATPLQHDRVPDWIDETAPQKAARTKDTLKHNRQLNIIIKGGCDLLQIKNYLIKGSRFDAEVDYVSDKGFRINNTHTEILKRCSTSTLQQYGEVIDKIIFFDRDAFKTVFFSDNYHVHIYSVLDDYMRGLYQYRDTDFVIPFGDFAQDLTDKTCWKFHQNRSKKHRLDPGFLEWFKDNFTFLGALDTESFRKNLIWLCNTIGQDKLFIILNGSEVAYYPNPQNERWEHHKKMNSVLDETIKDMGHVGLCDVRTLTQSVSDHAHNIRHYSRRVYYLLAKKINELIEDRYGVSGNFFEKNIYFIKHCMKQTGRFARKRLLKRLLFGS